jgi:hypothetical protein
VVFRWETSLAAACLNNVIPVGFVGVVQCDGYPAYRAFADSRNGQIQLSGCWAHYRSVFADLAAARHYSEALAKARSQRRRRESLDELFEVLAADLLPDRPGRREPRAVKRRPKPYPRLMNHRHKFLEIPHQHRYRLDTAAN